MYPVTDSVFLTSEIGEFPECLYVGNILWKLPTFWVDFQKISITKIRRQTIYGI